jgi:hypothetical protein
LRFKQDKLFLIDAMACMLNMNITQNATKMLLTFSKVSEEDLYWTQTFKNYQNVMQLNSATGKFVYEWIHWLKKTGNSIVYRYLWF